MNALGSLVRSQPSLGVPSSLYSVHKQVVDGLPSKLLLIREQKVVFSFSSGSRILSRALHRGLDRSDFKFFCRCADCLARGPTWASVNLGVFVCLNCSGIHRSLGTDLSKVRSTTLDTWLPEQVAFVQQMGNRRANLFWEGRLPRNFKRPAEGDMLGLRHFINDKYRHVNCHPQQHPKNPNAELEP